MLLPVVLLLVTFNGDISEGLLAKKEPQTGNARSKISDTNKQRNLQSVRSNDKVPLQSYSGNLESEEPLLYGFFPAGFIWGAATSAFQVLY